MRKKPRAVTRKATQHKHEFSSYVTLDAVNAYMDDIKERNEVIDVELGIDHFYDSEYIYIEYTILEDQKVFEERLKLYEEALENYRKWEVENAEEIAKYNLFMKAKKEKKEEVKRRVKELENMTKCTCPKTCKSNCKGECGCELCHDSYQDFLSGE